jgi:hypothetical protein
MHFREAGNEQAVSAIDDQFSDLRDLLSPLIVVNQMLLLGGFIFDFLEEGKLADITLKNVGETHRVNFCARSLAFALLVIEVALPLHDQMMKVLRVLRLDRPQIFPQSPVPLADAFIIAQDPFQACFEVQDPRHIS